MALEVFVVKPGTTLPVLIMALASWSSVRAQPPPLKGYATRLNLDTPILPGKSRTITGGGAPDGAEGIWVELWTIAAGERAARAVASAAAADGEYAFEGVPAAAGDAFFVTLSRSWRFETDGDLEGWKAVNDVILSVSGGVLRAEVRNLDGNEFSDPHLQTFFAFDPAFYRVVEIRLRNPAPPASSKLLGVFWGAPWGTTVSEHNAEIPTQMDDFQTIQIPMNVAESCVIPCGGGRIEDGLWDTGVLNDSLRLDPLNNNPAGDHSVDRTVFEIDHVRIRESYLREFHLSGDTEGILATHDIADLALEGGLLHFVARDVGGVAIPGADGVLAPHLSGGLETGHLDTAYFTRFALGVEGTSIAVAPLLAAILFDDADSTAYRDDCPLPGCAPGETALQEVSIALGTPGRQDVALVMDDLERAPGEGAGEWTEDGGRIPTGSLRLDLPRDASAGDTVRIDYFGWIPDEPFGPSDAVVATPGPVIFHRGDPDDSGDTDLSDAIFIFNWLVGGGREPVCLDSADANDDGIANLTDGIFLLSFSFKGGPPPPPPGPAPVQCNPDPTEDGLGCGGSAEC